MECSPAINANVFKVMSETTDDKCVNGFTEHWFLGSEKIANEVFFLHEFVFAHMDGNMNDFFLLNFFFLKHIFCNQFYLFCVPG